MTREKLKEIKELTHSVECLKRIKDVLEKEHNEYLRYESGYAITDLVKTELFTSVPKKVLLSLVNEAVSKKEEEILSKL